MTTVTLLLDAPTGTTKDNDVALTDPSTISASTEPISTWLAVLRFLPVRRTVAPIEDLDGENDDTSGMGITTAKLLLDSEIPDALTSLIRDVDALAGTTAVSCLDETTENSASTSPK